MLPSFPILFHRCLRRSSQHQCWTCYCRSNRTGALFTGRHCSGSPCSGSSTQHLQHLQIRHQTLCGLLPEVLIVFPPFLCMIWICVVLYHICLIKVLPLHPFACILVPLGFFKCTLGVAILGWLTSHRWFRQFPTSAQGCAAHQDF